MTLYSPLDFQIALTHFTRRVLLGECQGLQPHSMLLISVHSLQTTRLMRSMGEHHSMSHLPSAAAAAPAPAWRCYLKEGGSDSGH